MNEFRAGEHGGTHMDAPYHFNKNGAKIGQLPLHNFLVPGVVIDISEEVEINGPNTTLEPRHIIEWEEKYGKLPENALVLIKFGWSQYYPNKEAYLGPEYSKSILSFPGISKEAAEWVVKNRKIVGMGVDAASVDPGFSQTFDAHIILTAHGLYLVENAKLVEELPPRNFTLIALPMNIAEGTGAPLRLIAVPHNFMHF